MKILSVSLANFRSYKGLHEFDFSGYSEDKNLYTIWAVNNAGKSKLVDAIRWCFYGVNADSSEKWKSPINVDAWADPNTNTIEFYVIVKFEFNGEKFQVIRGKHNLQKSISDPGDDAARDQLSRSAFEKINDAPKVNRLLPTGAVDNSKAFGEDFISQRFPLSLSKYFFLSGEFLSTDPKEEEKTRPLLEAQLKFLVGLTYYETARATFRELLENARRDLAKKATGSNAPAIQRLTGELEALERQTKADEAEIATLEQKSHVISNQVSAYEEKINRWNDATPLITELRDLRALESTLINAKEAIVSRQIELLTTKSHVLMMQPLYKKFAKVYKGHLVKNLPVNVSKQALINIKKSDECICGREVSSDANALEKIEHLYQNAVFADTANFWAQLELQTNQATAQVTAVKEELSRIRVDLATSTREINSAKLARDRVERKLKKLGAAGDDLDLAKFEEDILARAGLNLELQAIATRKSALKSQLSDWVVQRAKIQSDLRQLTAGQKDVTKYRARVGSLEKLNEYIDEILRMRHELLIPTLRRYFEDYFREMSPIRNRVAKLEDDLSWTSYASNDKGDLLVVDEGGGITQALRIAVLLSMLRIAREWAKLDRRVKHVDYDLPIVLDAPLGQLQDDMSQKLISTVVEASGQVILLGNHKQLEPISELLCEKSYKQVYLTYHALPGDGSVDEDELARKVYGQDFVFRTTDQTAGIGFVEIGGEINCGG
jgi:DNA sulfur modification protein DndD